MILSPEMSGEKMIIKLNRRKFCACGCGTRINPKNTWAPGHHNRGVGGYLLRVIPDHHECECGCGELVASNVRFKKNHHLRGKTNWSKGLTKETDKRIKKISDAKKDITFTEEHKISLSVAAKKRTVHGHTGCHVEDAVKEVLRNKSIENAKVNPNYGMKNRHFTEETKQLQSDSGKKHWARLSVEERELKVKKIIDSVRRPEIRTKISESIYALGLKMEKASNWRGGKSFENYPQEFDNDLKMGIRERDNFVCCNCGKLLIRGLHIHHIDYNKRNCLPDNLISLCRSCHMKTNCKNHDYWMAFYKAKVLPLSELDKIMNHNILSEYRKDD